MIQAAVVGTLMVSNNLVWVLRKKWNAGWHTFHYFVAAFLIIAYLPHPSFPGMSGPKYGYTHMNLFIFQVILGLTAGLTHFHQFIILLLQMIYQV